MTQNKTLHFLVVGANQEIIETLKRIIEKTEGWFADLQSEGEHVFDIINKNNYDIVLVSSGLSAEFESQIESYCAHPERKVHVIMHYGGGSGLLQSEVYTLFPELYKPPLNNKVGPV